MKRCPQCNRTYFDETFSFCLADGALLSAPYDPNATLVIPQPNSPNTAAQEIISNSALPSAPSPKPPEQLSNEQRRLHNEARRFARLLISEIKLYNEMKVKKGRENKDLYDRLKEDIDRSRQMYNTKYDPELTGGFDYFHQELIVTLCEGDPSKLGRNYPFPHPQERL